MLRKIVASFLLIILLVQTTGVTLVHHYCSMEGSREIAAFDGVAEDVCGGCCCAEPQAANLPARESRPAFDAPSCCYEITTYLKFNFISTLTVPSFFQPMANLSWKIVELPPVETTGSKFLSTYPFYQFYSPPLSGFDLLRAIHQIKIPPFSSLS